MSVKEEDLYKIKMAGYGRMRPDRVPLFLWGTFVFAGAMVAVSLFGVIQADLLVNPLLITAVRVMTMVLGGQLLLNILFSITPIAYALQKSQIIFATFIAILFSVETYLFFFTAADTANAPRYFFNTAFALMAGGFILLILMTFRAFRRVEQGELKREGKGLYNFKESKNILIGPGIFGLVMIAGSLSRAVSNMDGTIGMFYVLFLCIILQYSMAIAIPEFILLIYGKFKFKSFIVPPRNRQRNKKKRVARF